MPNITSRTTALHPQQVAEDPQVIAQVARREEVGAHVLLAAAAEGLAQGGVAKDVERSGGTGINTVDEIPGDPVLDLERYPADVAADELTSLPDRLGHRQAEALARRLLDDDVRLRLERVDLDRADVVEVVEDVDVRIAVGMGDRRVEVVPALG